MSRPVIGVTGPDRGGLAAWWFTALALCRAGARPLRLRPGRSPEPARLDGLVVGGGADVDPALYGEEIAHPQLAELRRRSTTLPGFLLTLLLFPLIWILRRLLSTGRQGGDPDRDRLETRLLERALTEGLPVLGICRGAQLLNVVCGGSLHQHLHDFYRETPNLDTIWPQKTVDLVMDSRLAAVLGRTRCQVNSLHRQAIRTTGEGLRVVARDRDHVIQAVEHTDPDRWLIGVQWHPEYLPQRREQRRLFRALVRAARGD